MRFLKLELDFHRPGEFVQYSIPKKSKVLSISRSIDERVYLHLIYEESSDAIMDIDLVGFDGSGHLELPPKLHFLGTLERAHQNGVAYSLHMFSKQKLV